MSTTPGRAPVLRLNHDLLYYILKMNADMFSDNNALKITRMASYVCRDWRNFMLSTSSLWAKLIDLESLDGAADAWRNELMRRSGTALLWIMGRGLSTWGDTSGIISFFFTVISENWHRIQKLVAGIEAWYGHSQPWKWTPLYLPAPNLQTFNLSFCNSLNGRFEEDYAIGPLFANNAPSLREFRSSDYRFELNAAWLHQLHLIEIDVTLTLDELLTTLTVASNLKHLLLDRAYFEDVSPTLPTVSMPNLCSLTLFGYLEREAILFDYLELPPGCTLKLHFRTEVVDYSEIEDIYCPNMQRISRLARNVFRTHVPQKLLLECYSHEVALQDKTREEEPCFDFQIYFKYTLGQESLSDAHAIFLGEFSLPELSEVTEIHLQNSGYHLEFTTLVAFLENLPSIKVIRASKYEIYCLEQEFRKQNNFPLLQFFEEPWSEDSLYI
ncbi:hypothetical protein HYPSUDRAFT_45582 [Hypholoma sublateritium FD-334 SS-4]|uniref:F-box domain-containing protein n=1 Tax=Hypholoma sublateritium (strain FD-334 SS-4) TaxID=945553 RepID=A0A0D2NMZ6_HYPSF|nr:hypothetical protein HYPSUDRAFT_45582 [Hypholoma sublateritium FD-334 SS-4]